MVKAGEGSAPVQNTLRAVKPFPVFTRNGL